MTDDLRERSPSHLPVTGGTIWRRYCIDGIQQCNRTLSKLKRQKKTEESAAAREWLADRIIETLEVRDVLETLLNYFQDRHRSEIDELVESTQDLAKWNRHLVQLLTPDNPELDEAIQKLLEEGRT